MSKADELLALAERCEKAEHGSFALECEIAKAIGSSANPPRNYTVSLDSARSLGGICVFASDIHVDGLPMVKIVADTSKTPIAKHIGVARTLELAWCAAALRAAAEMEG